MTDKQIVFCTAGSEEEARKIARHLVEHRLAACVNLVLHLTSIYQWQGEIEEGREWLLLIKTSSEMFGSIHAAIRELHSYELPECIAVDIADGSPAYLKWIENSLSKE